MGSDVTAGQLSSALYDDATEVEVPVPDAPDDGRNVYVFDRWEGDVLSGHESDDPLIVVMDGDKRVTAVFVVARRGIESIICGSEAGFVPAISLIFVGLMTLRLARPSRRSRRRAEKHRRHA